MNTISTGRKRTSKLRSVSGFLLLAALSAIFITGGISKIDSLDTFEWSFIDIGISDFTVAGILARLLIGLELLAGGFLILHLYLKRIAYPLTLGMLAVFTIYLLLLLAVQGNEGNCGCFGEWVYMSPLSSIWKNLAMIAATVLLYFIYPGRKWKWQLPAALITGAATLALPFILNPVNWKNIPETIDRPIVMDPLYKEGIANPPAELREGKHVVAFMSLGCPHCRKAAYLMHLISRQQPDIPLFMVLAGPEDQEEDFFRETRSENVPHMFFRDPDTFLGMSGPSLPAIYWINNSVIERKANYYQLDPVLIREWLNEKP